MASNIFTLYSQTFNSESTSSLLALLPKQTWVGCYDLYQWEGSWNFPVIIKAALAFQSNFIARDDDIIITSPPKAGTTWLKALVYAIIHGYEGEEEDPLVKTNPHVIVKNLESHLYVENEAPDLSGLPSPRVFHSHLPYNSLPASIKRSKCKIVYIARSPKDTFVSLYHFMNKVSRTPEQGPYPVEEAFNDFCNGVHPSGPYHDHVLEYWNQSQSNPKKICFLKYEELKREPMETVKRLADFLHKPFGNEDEAVKVLWRCSIERLKNLEVNVNGSFPLVKYSSFFRLGVVGDWKNLLTKEMTDRLDQLTRSKLKGSGLVLEI